MRTNRILGGAIAAGVIALGSTACVADDDHAMTIGYTAIGAAYSDLFTCADQGVFQKNGLNVQLKLLNSSSQLVAALASGSVRIGAGVVKSTAAGTLKGLNLKYVSLPIPRYYLEMWTDPSISSVPQLKGKKIGLSSPGSMGDSAVDALLADRGWSETDVDKTFLKSTPAEVTALEKGAVRAIVTQPPIGTQTRTRGFKKLMDFTKYPAAANAYTVTNAYLKTDRDAVAAFVKSDVECLALLHQNKQQAIKTIEKYSGNDDPGLAEYAYDFFNPVWAKVPSVDPKLVDHAFAEAAADAGVPKPSDTAQYVDNSFIDELQSSGFINNLYQARSE